MPGTIYIVDDDGDFLEMERSILEAHGYQVAGFSDPREALSALRTGSAGTPPGLLVTDLMMSRLDAGFTLARAVKSEPGLAGLPVIIVSAVSSQKGMDFRPRSASDLQAMGADAFFDKPVTPEAFLSKVRELLR
jgi:CheY-like chemotaxis protein